ncbi:hypothetical protein V1264_013795 [Littorina saxatilis]|uniref:Uncharacterized protein n=1 Tax=Littorina saxatilis TaxID=31220 RepID=A0AAN9BR46_9CAEN
MATNGSFNDTECYCDCDELEATFNRSGTAPTTQDEADEAAKKLVSELKVNKTNLSSTLRRKTSAPDHRPSAQGLGVVGVIVVVAVLVCIVALDLSVLCQDMRVAVCRVFGLDLPEGLHLARRRASYARRGRGFGGRGLRPGGPDDKAHHNAPMYSSFPDKNGEHDDDGAERESGARGSNNMASTTLPVPTSGVTDIKSRRELLMMHGAPR